MNVLFVQPRYDSGFGMKPISIAVLSGIAKSEGFQTSLLDIGYIDHEFSSYHYLEKLRSAKVVKPVNFSDYDFVKPKMSLEQAVAESMEKNKPDIIAISVISGQHILAEKITRHAKKHNRAVTVLWGGPYVTVSPLDALHRGADHVCVGEGLIPFREFLESFKEGKSVVPLKNIWTSYCRNKLGPIKKNLDDLPYLDWSIFDERDFLKPYDGKVLRGGDHMVTWGCPNRCSYCINAHYQDLYKDNNQRYEIKRYSVERIVKELKHLKEEYRLEFFKFCDENFLMAPVWYLEQFALEYPKKVDVPFTTACDPKTVTPEKIELLKKAGCVSLSIGIETGDARYRKDILNRRDTYGDIYRAFSLAKDAGIRTMAFNMMGLPYYNRDLYMKTIDLNRSAGVQNPTISFFYPFKGTKLRETAIAGGFYDEDDDKLGFRMEIGEPSLHFDNLSKSELKEMFNVFVLYVKLPKCYWKYIRRSEETDDVGKRLRTKLLQIFESTVWEDDDQNYVRELEGIFDETNCISGDALLQ